MPVYDYACTSCGAVEERVHSIAALGIQQYCSICNGRMTKLLSAPMVHVSKVEYRCPITNALITTKQQHINNLAKHGCRVLETGEVEQAKRKQLKSNEELDKKIESEVEKLVETMPSEKKEKLASELASGVDLTTMRG